MKKKHIKHHKHYKKKSKLMVFLKSLILNPLVQKAAGALVVAIISYAISHLQSAGTINQLKIDNKDLSWAVDYFR